MKRLKGFDYTKPYFYMVTLALTAAYWGMAGSTTVGIPAATTA